LPTGEVTILPLLVSGGIMRTREEILREYTTDERKMVELLFDIRELLNHQPKWKCLVCGQECKSELGLKSHERVHKG
jgi:hypothetical protein